MVHSVNPLSWTLTALAVSTLLVLGPVAKATEPANPPNPGTVLPSLDELLERDTAVDYGESKRCLSLHKFKRVQALDENHILFEVRGGKYYLVQLERRCPGLRPQNAVSYEPRSSRLCAMDRVRGAGVTAGFSPNCQLGRFQSITEEQLVILKDTLKNRDQNDRHRGKSLKDAKPGVLPADNPESNKGLPASKS